MAKAKGQNDSWRITLNLLFAVTQIAGGFITQLTGLGTSIQAQSAGAQTPVIPAAYAFAIWGPIFVLALLYAVYQALPGQRDNKLLREIGFFTAAAFLGNTIWELVAQFVTFNWPTAIIIIFTLAASLGALFRLEHYPKATFIVTLPVSMLAGWISAATFANISSVLAQLGYSSTTLALIILAAAAGLATGVIARTRGNMVYTLTVVWALIAIVIANTQRAPNPPVALLATGLIAVLIITTVFYQKPSGRG
jgi:hypothetical protein